MDNPSPFIRGFHYFLAGIGDLTQKGLRRYVVLPILANAIVFAVLIYVGIHWFGLLIHWVESLLPTWLHWLNVLLWIIFALSAIIIMAYTFTLIANLIATPFNGLLAEKAEMFERGTLHQNNDPWYAFIKDIPRDLKRQLQFIFYYLPRAILGLILFFIPLVQTIAAPLWFMFNAWMMSIQYMDYPMDNHRIEFKKMRQKLLEKRAVNFGFGCAVLLFTMVPVLNFIAMPAAVIGATKLWVKEYEN